jgi:hypothetical protein
MLPATLPPTIYVRAAEAAESSPEAAQLIHKCLATPIRGMAKGDAARNIVSQVRLFCTLAGVDAPAQEAMAAAVEFVTKHYAGLAPVEVYHAAQLWAAGKLNAKSEFYGRFSLVAFGQILFAYAQYRNAIVHALDKEADRAAKAAREVKLKEEGAEYRANFDVHLAAFDGTKFTDVPVFWYDICKDQGRITWQPGEWLPVWTRAQVLARLEFEADDPRKGRFVTPELLDGRARALAQKIAVWMKVLGNDMPDTI